MSGRNFYPRKTDDGRLIDGTTRQQAEAWWVEVQSKGEKKLLIETASAGGDPGYKAARKLVSKYPDAALDAIEAGARASAEEGTRAQFVEVAGLIPGDEALIFLRSQLAPGTGVYSQVEAAKALLARGEPEAVPAMIATWGRNPGPSRDRRRRCLL